MVALITGDAASKALQNSNIGESHLDEFLIGIDTAGLGVAPSLQSDDIVRRTVESKQDAATINNEFGMFQCKEAAAAALKTLQKNNKHGYVIQIQFSGIGNHNNIWSDTAKCVISENGFHCGVAYKGLVYCNIHPYGLPESVWLEDFVGFGEREVVRIPF